KVLVWVSVLGSLMALFLGMAQGLVNLEKGMQAWVNGARSMLLAMCVLVLAWAINGVCKDLHTADFIVALVRNILTPWLVPAIIFLVSCAISFATGTSWGTMAIMLPISIPLAYHLNLDAFRANPAAYAGWTELAYVKTMMLVSIGAVLEGSIFGDHCSPISDTTIMSSMASGSDHIDHVRTQAPYAVAVAVVSLLVCYIPAGCGFNPFVLIPCAMVALVIVLNVLGSSVMDAQHPASQPTVVPTSKA
ncbi:MAG TPA: Na+/H+ antiporter NhaC family protein, partial [Candidatus Ozemobacteraceae bacterium]|nr:Na+/H+ antiporter NhaC family protein [Candidatus Ozemobacteraceae bacterium]